jgi:methyltransferase
MVGSPFWYILLLLAIALERVVELVVSRRHARWSLERGGVEFGVPHFRWMKALHTLFLVACAVEVVFLERTFEPLLGWTMLGIVVLAQVIRYWAIGSLGKQWNVRVIVVPGAPRITRGPYRFMKHPNYLAVVLEGFAVPLVHGAWITACVFSLLNAWLLSVRIRVEERALALLHQQESTETDRTQPTSPT